MNVLWVNEAASFAGGCERYIWDTASLLQRHGVQSTLVYNPNVAVHPKYLEVFRRAFPMVDLPAQLRDIDPDLVYIHRLEGTAPLIAILEHPAPALRFYHDHKLFCLREHKYTALRQKTCTKTVGLNCYSCLGFVNRTDSWPNIKLHSVASLRREQEINRSLAGFVVGSEYMAKHLDAHGFDRRKTHKIPLFSTPPEASCQQRREPDLLLFVGSLDRGKGVDILLDALTLVQKPARLLVVGQGSQEREFQRQARVLGLERQVTFVGKVAREDLDSYYSRATCLVVPSRMPETFALVGAEAMSFGTPVVASDVGGVREWLEDGVTGFAVEPGSPKKLAGAIDRLLDDPVLARSMGAHALEVYGRRLVPERHTRRLFELFQTLDRTSQRLAS